MSEQTDIELGQSFPVETSLMVPGIRLASDLWVEMIEGAETSIDIEQFYMSSAPSGVLERAIDALIAAARRGVVIRIILDQTFYERVDEVTGRALYTDVAERLVAVAGVSLRTVPFGRLTGGVQHAKFFIVDDRDAWLGSQNFDWRSIEHISELGVRLRVAALVKPLMAVFEADWTLAGRVEIGLGAETGSARLCG